jgi:hypothetical protein
MPLVDLSSADKRISGAYVWALMHYPDDVGSAISYMHSMLLSSFYAYECDKCEHDNDCIMCCEYTKLIGEFTGFVGGPGELYDALFSKQKNKMTSAPHDRFIDGILAGHILAYAIKYNESITKAIQKVFHYYVSPMISNEHVPQSYTEDHLANNV